MTMLFSAYQLDEVALKAETPAILIALVLLIAAIVLWCWHLFLHKAPNKMQLALALLLSLSSMTVLQHLFLISH